MEKVTKKITREELHAFLIYKQVVDVVKMTDAIELYCNEVLWEYNLIGYIDNDPCLFPGTTKVFLEKKNDDDLFIERLEYFIDNLETQNPRQLKQDDEIEHLHYTISGICAYCKRKVKDWQPVFGSFAPEWWESMREIGVNPSTGHLLNCTRPFK